MGLEIAFLALDIPTALGLLLPAGNKRRVLLVLVIALFTGRYVSWRIGNFPFGSFFTSPEGWWMAAVLVVEMLAILEYVQFLVTITWLTDRRAEADAAEQRLRERYAREGEDAIPSVDVLIPTHNEGPEVVTKTILAALQLDYPRFRSTCWMTARGPGCSSFASRWGLTTSSDRIARAPKQATSTTR
jgi:uncharacterized membrane protein